MIDNTNQDHIFVFKYPMNKDISKAKTLLDKGEIHIPTKYYNLVKKYLSKKIEEYEKSNKKKKIKFDFILPNNEKGVCYIYPCRDKKNFDIKPSKKATSLMGNLIEQIYEELKKQIENFRKIKVTVNLKEKTVKIEPIELKPLS